jgi:uncharacterized protein YjdB
VAATVAPSNATNQTVIWSTGDSTVAAVADGVVTAKAPGTATITATTTDGGKTATCSVTVVAANIVAAPFATPEAGTISLTQSISLESDTSGVTIYYTINDTSPTASTGTLYNGPFTLPGLPATVKAIAVKEGMTDSTVLTAE